MRGSSLARGIPEAQITLPLERQVKCRLDQGDHGQINQRT